MGDEHTTPRRDLTRAIAEATRSFFTPTSLEDTLRGVTESARSLIPAVDCADILIVRGPKKYQSHAATSELRGTGFDPGACRRRPLRRCRPQ
ncbi:hypothetical protein [Rhodococcus sp. P1Y]|uniref:hypothetical protein n=1 Tax=Rhodococcus sp. P1Y TaxID=1302308 RepID=UPI001F2C7B03|nr:hypothetical protein [Rhodococcus sp. P1Y]